jgi:HK97 family phage major capsid protein
MRTILELREKRNKIWNTAKDFLDSSRGADGTVSTEAAAQYEKMEADMVNLGKEIDRLERQAAYDMELNKATSTAVTNAPAHTEAAKTGRASNEYKEDFANALRNKKPVHNVLSTSPDSDGGYLVPVEFERQIVKGLDEYNVIRRIARVINTNAERKIPVAADRAVATWTPENAAISETMMTFAQKSLDAYKLSTLARVSIELLQDSMFNLEAYIAEDFARAFGIAEEEAFCIGDGDDKPTGIFLNEGGGTIGVTTTTAAINTDHLIDLIYALKSPYRRNAVFLMRDITVSAIRKLKDANGQYLWQPSVQAGEPDRLLGYRLFTSPYVPIVEAGSLPVAFGDFNHYWIADRMGRTVQRLNELFAGNGQVGFIGNQRVDAKVILAEGIQLLKIAGGGTNGGGG